MQMSDKVSPVLEGKSGPTPYLTVRDGAAAIEFYKSVFRAVETLRIQEQSGRIGHAELAIGSGAIMLSDEYPEMEVRGPEAIGGTPVTLHLYVEDVDSTVERAVAAGAKILRPIADQFYGDRAGKIVDPFGHQWFLSTRKEVISEEEMKRRAKELYE
jgi:PhnB protein